MATCKRLNVQRGASLVELVATITLLGILAVSVLPRFTSRGGFVEYALKDQLTGLYLAAQQRAMFDHSGACYALDITATGASIEKDAALLNDQSHIDFSGDYAGLSVTATTVYFDPLGNVLTGGTDCSSATAIAGVLNISVSGDATASMSIYPTGYVARNL
ncbi:MAG: type II secretion system protein [Pseudomonadales bacterium]|nr:type II secretion system protein [Pseudomonadales bacterium]